MVGDLLYCITEVSPRLAVKLTWTACDIVGHVINCQVCDIKWLLICYHKDTYISHLSLSSYELLTLCICGCTMFSHLLVL